MMTKMKAGCFYCLQTFDSCEIKLYDKVLGNPICPYCGADSVVIDTNESTLKELYKKVFSKTKETKKND